MNTRKRIPILLVFAIALCTLTACGNNSTTHPTETPTSTNLPVYTEVETTSVSEAQPKCSLVEMTATGQITFDNLFFNPSIYDHIYPDCSGLLPFEFNGKYGYVDETGTVVIDNIYSSASIFSEGKALVEHGDNMEVIDTSGNVLFSFPTSEIDEDYWSARSNLYYTNGYLIIHTLKGEVIKVLDSNCNEIELSDIKGTAYYSNSLRDGSAYLKDYAGNKLVTMPFGCIYCPTDKISFTFDDSTSFMGKTLFARNGYANVANEDKKWGLYDLNSHNIVIDYKYDYVGMYSDGVIPVASYSKWGLIDLEGNTLIPCDTYTYIGPFSNGRAFATIENDAYIIDKDGNILFTVSGGFLNNNYYVHPFSEKSNFAIVECQDKRIYIMTNEGEVIYSSNKFDYDYICENYIVNDGILYKFVLE